MKIYFSFSLDAIISLGDIESDRSVLVFDFSGSSDLLRSLLGPLLESLFGSLVDSLIGALLDSLFHLLLQLFS